MQKKLFVKKDDMVYVISGSSKGKKGKVLAVSPNEGKIIVEGVRIVTKHAKPRKQGQPGGLIKTEGPMAACKVKVICPVCKEPTRVGHIVLPSGEKKRQCKRAACKETF